MPVGFVYWTASGFFLSRIYYASVLLEAKVLAVLHPFATIVDISKPVSLVTWWSEI